MTKTRNYFAVLQKVFSTSLLKVSEEPRRGFVFSFEFETINFLLYISRMKLYEEFRPYDLRQQIKFNNNSVAGQYYVDALMNII